MNGHILPDWVEFINIEIQNSINADRLIKQKKI